MTASRVRFLVLATAAAATTTLLVLPARGIAETLMRARARRKDEVIDRIDPP
ncbi:MAG: hypothetical protein QOH16_3902 [Gaiellaceae bacterium]|nr:hypothetical protein [Gaiellaceae bacterium]